MKRISITNLEHAIRYLEERISQRLTTPEKIAFPDFDISDASDPFFRTIAEMKLSLEEFLILLIALVPHVYPDFFDRVVAKNLKKDNDLPAFGGIKTAEQRTMMPTVSTALFVLAGDDIQKRMDLLALFNHQHPFYQQRILRLEQPRTGESMLNRRILLDDEYTELFTQGYVSPPKFSSSFPAQLLHTEQEWSDLVLPPLVLERIEEIKTWIEQSSTLMEDWGMKRVLKPGYRALFHGPPGTGKTLTASLLGRYTGRDVFRVDLSAVVSKYIGETEKNLSQLFDKAENKSWILFFDEADALFGKRTGVKDAHDRYANQEVSYLLQRVEEFSGLIILASNLKSNLDEAFLRRFNTIIHFPLPDVEERLQLWRKAFPDAVTLDVDLVEVAARYELAGGSIINVVQYACLKSLQRSSNKIRMKDVLQGIRREIEKDGRLFKSLM
ncbi:ATP-binding protein [Lewinella cohaerens]|uniref:ATP-binding protein n=1 Tax=Lewinella cohaerens TaxID=70995 RepID=UPI00037DFB85|nr:ATP-binding protein [Lewinella cohaerens]